MKKMPAETTIAPSTNTGAGTSWNRNAPNSVAPTGSSKAMVAVSKDLRFDRDEKYNVCAIAVGSKPSPNIESIVPSCVGKVKTVFPPTRLRAPATTAAKA